MATKTSKQQKVHFWLFPISTLIVICSSCGSPSTIEKENYIEIDTLSPGIVFDSIGTASLAKDTLYKYYDTLQFDGQVYFVSQGDVLIPEAEFERLLSEEWLAGSLERTRQKAFKTDQKIVIEYDLLKNDTIKWRQFPIRFCIDSASFQSTEKYKFAKRHMLQAVNDWSGVCGVKFQHIEGADKNPLRAKDILDFVVKYERKESSRYEAIAFGPNTTKELRQLRLFEPYWTTDYEPAGVLRHEIGHILGFRHEHSAYLDLVPLACRIKYPEKERPTRPVSVQYDSKSVMHYLCGGAGTRELTFSRFDSLGASQVYGKK